jgi:hypothetical protein
MGIRNLNRYLLENCHTAITTHPLRNFARKKVVVDTSIYLYRFIADGALIPQLYAMISILLSNEITPIFVFDGKAPAEKWDLLQQRHFEKIEAREKYENLEKILNVITDPIEQESIRKEMEVLKRQMTRVTDENTAQAKALFDACGVQWIVADGESDHICAYMVKSKKAWACISDDMDMFVLGCTRVLRNFHLVNQTVMYYSLPSILRELSFSMTEFRQIAVISGTDYNINQTNPSNTNLIETLKWFYEYKRFRTSTQGGNQRNSSVDFYDWLQRYTKYVKSPENLSKIYHMFDIPEKVEYKYSSVKIQIKRPNYDAIFKIMQENGVVMM